MIGSKHTAIVVSILLVASAVGVGATAAAAGGASQQQAYAGSHVSFDTTGDAVVDYIVNGESVLESVTVQSKSEAHNQAGIEAGVTLSAVTNLAGAGLSVESETETSATVTSESGAQLQAHDNERGILTIHAGEESQYVTIGVAASSQAESESDQRVVVTTEDGTQGAFIVVGDGAIAVNDEGNVSAKLQGDSQLVYRCYAEERTDDDREQEQLIADGHAAAEVYVMQQAEAGSETVVDVVQYSEDTTVDVIQQSEGTVEMTAERTEHEGKVIITSVSDAVISSTDEMEVTVDGEAAVQASSYSELESAIDDGETSKYYVSQGTSAEGSADVLVAVNHFSERQITMAEGESSDGGESDGTDVVDSDLPGFGFAAGVVGFVMALLGIAYRRE